MRINKARVIDGFYKTNGELILCMHGNPGSGKTSTCIAYCERNNIPYYYIPAGKVSLDQISGTQVMNDNTTTKILTNGQIALVANAIGMNEKEVENLIKEKGFITESKLVQTEQIVKTAPPEFVYFLNEHPDGMLIVDELATADKVKQGLLLSIILDCRGFGWSFPKTVRRVCMTNDSFASTGNNTLISALNDRVCHVWTDGTWLESVQDRKNSYGIFPECKVAGKSEAMKYHIQNMDLIIDFMKSYPKYQERYLNETRIQGLEDEKMKMTSYLSDRTESNLNLVLDYFSGMLTVPENAEFGIESGMKFLQNIIAGYAGEDFAADFMKFIVGKLDNRFTFDPVMYEGKEKDFNLSMVIDPDQNDQVALVVRSMWMYFNSDPKRWYKLWIKILNLTFNSNNQYGKYTGYASYSIQYIHPTVQTLIKKIGTKNLAKIHEAFDAYREGSDEIKVAVGLGSY